MDYCSPNNNWSYIDDYLLHLVHPNVQRVSQLRGANVRKMSYIASYIFLINYLAQKDLFPKVKLYKDTDVEIKDVDMVVDIGNSRTTALLIEDNTNFNQVRQLELIDYTNLVKNTNNSLVINKHNEPFDMRLAFRKVDFGSFGIKDSKQFVHPSLVRLGQEANTLIHLATNTADDMESLSTYSSPKRYLWDWRPNKEEWKFLVLKDEKDDHILNLRGITNQLKSDGSIDLSGESGSSYHYSRRSLMTFSFLEMLVQARIQINSEEYRSNRSGFGKPSIPRRIRRIIVTLFAEAVTCRHTDMPFLRRLLNLARYILMLGIYIDAVKLHVISAHPCRIVTAFIHLLDDGDSNLRTVTHICRIVLCTAFCRLCVRTDRWLRLVTLGKGHGLVRQHQTVLGYWLIVRYGVNHSVTHHFCRFMIFAVASAMHDANQTDDANNHT